MFGVLKKISVKNVAGYMAKSNAIAIFTRFISHDFHRLEHELCQEAARHVQFLPKNATKMGDDGTSTPILNPSALETALPVLLSASAIYGYSVLSAASRLGNQKITRI